METIVEVVPVTASQQNYTDNCPCGEESEFGCHGVRNGQVYSEYFCKKCKNQREE